MGEEDGRAGGRGTHLIDGGGLAVVISAEEGEADLRPRSQLLSARDLELLRGDHPRGPRRVPLHLGPHEVALDAAGRGDPLWGPQKLQGPQSEADFLLSCLDRERVRVREGGAREGGCQRMEGGEGRTTRRSGTSLTSRSSLVPSS